MRIRKNTFCHLYQQIRLRHSNVFSHNSGPGSTFLAPRSSGSHPSPHSWHDSAFIRPFLWHSLHGGPPWHLSFFFCLAHGGHFTGLIAWSPVDVRIHGPFRLGARGACAFETAVFFNFGLFCPYSGVEKHISLSMAGKETSSHDSTAKYSSPSDEQYSAYVRRFNLAGETPT